MMSPERVARNGQTDYQREKRREPLPHVTVIIVNYQSGGRLSRCLESLQRSRFDDFETIVVDNASTDGSERVAESRPDVRLIRADENLGFAAANNLASKQARGDWLAFLNPDAYPDEGWLDSLIAATRRHPDTDAFGSLQVDAATPQRLDGAGDVYHAFGVPYRGHFGWPTTATPQEGETFAPCAAAALYRRSVFELLGGFDERFFCYGEDVDLGFRLRLNGGRCIQVNSARVLHEGSGITGKHSAFSIYHGHRNRVWTYYLNMPAPLLIATLPFHFAVNVYLFVRFCFVGEASSYARAMRDGFAGLPSLTNDRKNRQTSRVATVLSIARALTWSPLKVMRRQADIRETSLKTTAAEEKMGSG